MDEILYDYFFKKIEFYKKNLNSSSSSITYILLNNSNIFLAQCINRNFILTGCREYLYFSVCIWYDADFTQMKR